MNSDNFILFIIFIITLIMISLFKECNKDRLKELENDTIKNIIEEFYHLGSAAPSDSGQWGYKIVGITNGQYGGRSRQQVLNNIGGHNIGHYINTGEKDSYSSYIIDSTIEGDDNECGNIQYNTCKWTDSSGTELSPNNITGKWRKTIRSIDYKVNDDCGNIGDLLECDKGDVGVKNDVNCDNNHQTICGTCDNEGIMRYKYNTNPRRIQQYNGAVCNSDEMNPNHIQRYCIDPLIANTDNRYFNNNISFSIKSQSVAYKPSDSIMHTKQPRWHLHDRKLTFKFNISLLNSNKCNNRFLNLNSFEISSNYNLNGSDESSSSRKHVWTPEASLRNIITYNSGRLKSFEIFVHRNKIPNDLKKYIYVHKNTQSIYNSWKSYAGNDAVVLFNGCCRCSRLVDWYYKFGHDTLPGTTGNTCGGHRPASKGRQATFKNGYGNHLKNVSAVGIHNSKLEIKLWDHANRGGSTRIYHTRTIYDNRRGGYHMGGGTRLMGMGNFNDKTGSAQVYFTGNSFMSYLKNNSTSKHWYDMIIRIERENESFKTFKVTYLYPFSIGAGIHFDS